MTAAERDMLMKLIASYASIMPADIAAARAPGATAPALDSGTPARMLRVGNMTPKEELGTYFRADIREFTIIDKGLMPSVEGKLNARQVADIVSYLSSLKGS